MTRLQRIPASGPRARAGPARATNSETPNGGVTHLESPWCATCGRARRSKLRRTKAVSELPRSERARYRNCEQQGSGEQLSDQISVVRDLDRTGHPWNSLLGSMPRTL